MPLLLIDLVLTRHAVPFAFAALFALAACNPPPPPEAPAPSPPVVRAYTQFSPGDPIDLVRVQLGLDKYEARYRSGLPQDLMGIVYFLDDGNLHIDAKKVGETWVLVATPLLDPSDVPAADRVAEWDRGADQQNLDSKGLR
jgi:hypothetical protein